MRGGYRTPTLVKLVFEHIYVEPSQAKWAPQIFPPDRKRYILDACANRMDKFAIRSCESEMTNLGRVNGERARVAPRPFGINALRPQRLDVKEVVPRIHESVLAALLTPPPSSIFTYLHPPPSLPLTLPVPKRLPLPSYHSQPAHLYLCTLLNLRPTLRNLQHLYDTIDIFLFEFFADRRRDRFLVCGCQG